MTRLMRIVFAFMLLAPAVAFATGQPAQAQAETEAQADAAASTSYEDAPLHQALIVADLVDEWIEAGSVSPQAALVGVIGDSAYLAARDQLIDDLALLAERRAQIDERTLQIEMLGKDLDTLEELVQDLRHEVDADGALTLSLTPAVVEQAQRTLDELGSNPHRLGLSFDPVALAGHGLARTSASVGQQIAGLTLDASGSATPTDNRSLDEVIEGFSDVNDDLERIRSLVKVSAQASIVAEFEYYAELDAVIATMVVMHEMRHLATTSVGGLSVVTFDAYVRGANTLDASCPVDWALLAGIGRVESRHGTINNTVVQTSGLVSAPILGPLLDGGATEREAAEAIEAEIAALAAEETLRLAELEAEAAAEAAELAALETLVWGEQGAAERAEEREREAEGTPAVGLAATPEPVIEEPAPLFDPLLWGDDLPFDEDDLPSLEEDVVEEFDEDEAEFKGNGFAVIADSDNGRLDGNGRWDRAVGPMQFIPETWSHFETDGNGDGTIDPQNLYDAAATAGQFLCHLSRTQGASPTSFVLGYNSSRTYVRNVLAVAETFAVSDLPQIVD